MKSQIMRTPWLLRPAGRRLAKVLAGVGTTGGFLMYYLPNTLLIDNYQAITQLYRSGTPTILSEKIPPLVEAAMNDLQMNKDKQKLISIYTGYGFDLFRAGSTILSSKCILGVPISFKYEDTREFDQTGILVNNEPVQWRTPEGISLQESLVFSDEAKKFAIARELAHLNTAEPFINGLFTSSILFMCYTISSTVNFKLNLYAKTRGLRIVLYGLVSAFSYATWILCKDVSCVSYETSADETAANINENYAKGGLEYYEKILKRNIALRSLMGEKGEALYTAYGNDQVVLRTQHMPFTTRRDFMKNKVQEYSKGNEGDRSVDDSKKHSSIEVVKESLSSTADSKGKDLVS